ncbi:helix-turn-helix domain-containing protein [Spirillospora sp. NPDC048911]|uniref:helix-turn-helix domain-containing protein n=1 Tax=Spirillospora sp. NPDC048911 TaxID=3364527 RepID=UPI00371B9E4E
MSTSPSSSAQEARQRLGQQLRRMRTDADLTGVEFARRAGWSQSAMVSIVEGGKRTITADHIRLWCRICEAPDALLTELLAEQANTARMWTSYREETHQAGLNPTQKLGVGDTFEKLSRWRSYQTKVIPGLLQTEAYVTGVLRGVREERRLAVDDVAEAVTERLSRSRYLRTHRRFAFIVEEAALRYRMFGAEVHRQQLHHLMEVMWLPSVSFGVIPQSADRGGYRVREAFEIIDEDTVTIELLSGYLRLTHPAEVAMYRQAWNRLSNLAVVGDPARALVEAAIAALAQDGR